MAKYFVWRRLHYVRINFHFHAIFIIIYIFQKSSFMIKYLAFPVQGVTHWRVKSSGVRQSKIYNCPEHSFGREGVKGAKRESEEDYAIHFLKEGQPYSTELAFLKWQLSKTGYSRRARNESFRHWRIHVSWSWRGMPDYSAVRLGPRRRQWHWNRLESLKLTSLAII